MTTPPLSGARERLEALLAKSVEDYKKLSPVQKALHDSDQRRSFVRGQIGSDPGDVLADEVRRLTALLAQAEKALETIAKADVPFDKHGHYLAHRDAVKIARTTLTNLKQAREGAAQEVERG